MCVIIHRKPGITIPFDKLKSACFVNADGMGLVAIDRGKLELRKYFEAKGNNPDTLAKFLEDAKDLHVYAHLRYRTKGAKDKANVHPFSVLKSKKHGIDVQFMHNGTLMDFGTTEDCDSKHFAKSFLTPLAEKLLKAVGPEKLLHDDTLVTILDKYAGKGSVFLLADNLGNHHITNYDNGKEFDGWWASNEYSFNTSHRTKDDGPSYYSGGSYYSKRHSYWERDDDWKKDAPQTETKKEVSVVALPPPKSGGDHKPPFNDDIPFETAKKEVAKKPITNPTLPKRELFIERAELTQLADVCQLSMQQIEDLVDDYPEEAVMLIRDLIKELYDVEIADDIVDEVYEAA